MDFGPYEKISDIAWPQTDEPIRSSVYGCCCGSISFFVFQTKCNEFFCVIFLISALFFVSCSFATVPGGPELRKYLNPNMVAVSTVTKPDAGMHTKITNSLQFIK